MDLTTAGTAGGPGQTPAPGRPSLATRVPAQAVIEEVLRRQALHPAPRGWRRVLGVDPLGPDARSWYAGALGERRTAALLERLGPAWTVLHAVPVGSGDSDVDHVAIGPGGLVTINTKHHRGKRVWVGGRVVMVGGQRVPYVRNAEHEADRALRLVARAAGIDPTVTPLPVTPVVAVLGADRITVRDYPVRVRVVDDRHLVPTILSLPPVLDGAAVRRVVEAAARPETWTPPAAHRGLADGTAPTSDAVATRFDELVRAVGRARRRRVAWAGGLLATGTATAVGALSVLPGVLASLGG